jgi:hypothetical protein
MDEIEIKLVHVVKALETSEQDAKLELEILERNDVLFLECIHDNFRIAILSEELAEEKINLDRLATMISRSAYFADADKVESEKRAHIIITYFRKVSKNIVRALKEAIGNGKL